MKVENGMPKETIKSLNKLLQGEYMAVQSFNNFISRIEDDKVKNSFKDIQSQHRENINKLVSYIQDIGGKPEENLGMMGIMGEVKLNIDLGLKEDTLGIIDKAIEGETKGVNMAEKILRGNLDDKSRVITGEILEKDRESIEKLKDLKNIISSRKVIS